MKLEPRQIYDLLKEASHSTTPIQEVLIGLTWTLCQVDGIGVAMSPGQVTRTLPWSGTLVNRPVADLAAWIDSWNPFEATVGMAAINATLNAASPLLEAAQPLTPTGSGNLAVFEHFLPMIQKQRVVIIGRYPNLDQYEQVADISVIERQPVGGDFPDPACEYLLPQADWVFLTATSIINKTFPRLVELSQQAKLVLMGPTLPWHPALAEMGIDYLAGVRVSNPTVLRQTIAEGGGVRIFEAGVQYCVLPINA
ncbi:MAG: DUF364 domain-containing protein [Cyanobacteria bacterium P01_H01_bin.121]